MRFAGRRIAAGAVLGVGLLVPAAVHGQAWVVPEGQGSVAVVYHHVFVEDHFFSRGERRDVGHIRSHVVVADLEYGLTDRFTFKARLPYVAARYEGHSPHDHLPGMAPPDFERLDNEGYHSAFQDARVEARYAPAEFPVALAPYVALTVPTHDYEFFAHSAIGLNMRELQVGTYVSKLYGPLSLDGRASYGIYERVIGRRRNRSNMDLEVGLALGRKVHVSVLQAAQVSHGGVDIPSGDPNVTRQQWWPHHDQLGRANFLNIGAGASVRLSGSMSLQCAVLTTVAGRNTHGAKYGVSVGTSWSFAARGPGHASGGHTP